MWGRDLEAQRPATSGDENEISSQIPPRRDTRPTMSSQLLPLELIDRCVGSPIWVIMKGDKGESFSNTKLHLVNTHCEPQNSAALYSDLTTSLVCHDSGLEISGVDVDDSTQTWSSKM